MNRAEKRPSQPSESREAALLAAHRAGDPDALQELLGSYQDRLFAVCLRMCSDRHLAEDLLQQAMVKIIQGLAQFEGMSKLSTWMIRVTMNVCLTERRRSRLRQTVSLDSPTRKGEKRPKNAISNPEHSPLGSSVADLVEPDPGQRVIQNEQHRLLALAMQRIDAHYRAMLILRDVHDLDYKDIAEVLGIPAGTVKSRLFRARAALRDAFLNLAGPSEP